MNLGVEEAVDIGFKLAAVVKGYGGPLLLQSYSLDRRPTILRALDRSAAIFQNIAPVGMWCAESKDAINVDTPEGFALRKKIDDHLSAFGPVCASRGIEMDTRYRSPVIYQDTDGSVEPPWDLSRYTPSTLPGARAPHVFLKDGKTSIVDLYGKEFTLVEFTSAPATSPSAIPIFTKIATELHIPLTPVHIQDEDHVRTIWERNVVLVRADGHVAWRGNAAPGTEEEVRDVLQVVVG
jgi:FAD-dependent monooxygenase